MVRGSIPETGTDVSAPHPGYGGLLVAHNKSVQRIAPVSFDHSIICPDTVTVSPSFHRCPHAALGRGFGVGDGRGIGLHRELAPAVVDGSLVRLGDGLTGMVAAGLTPIVGDGVETAGRSEADCSGAVACVHPNRSTAIIATRIWERVKDGATGESHERRETPSSRRGHHRRPRRHDCLGPVTTRRNGR